MKKPSSPFPLTGYHGAGYFCDREEETRRLTSNIYGGISTVLTAQRRMGKTSLIKHVLAKQPSGVRSIYLDILPTENRDELLNELATAMVNGIADKKGFGRKVWDFIKSLRPTINFDNLTGSPQVTFVPGGQAADERIEAILSFLEKEADKTIIAIDEFQQILNYPGQNTDAWLRSVIQRMKNLVFIFSGSQMHLMTELFTLPARPFYNSAAMLKIGKIDQGRYKTFIKSKFNEASIRISDDIIDAILKWTDIHTYYVQLLCNRVYINSSKEVTSEFWKEEASKLLFEQEPVFYNYRGMLTTPQWKLLKAIGKQGEVYEVTSSEFINRNNLGSPATVLRSLKSLQKMELIYYDYNNNGKKYYSMNDLLFRRWVEMRE